MCVQRSDLPPFDVELVVVLVAVVVVLGVDISVRFGVVVLVVVVEIDVFVGRVVHDLGLFLAPLGRGHFGGVLLAPLGPSVLEPNLPMEIKAP